MALALNNLQRVDMPLNKETQTPCWVVSSLSFLPLLVMSCRIYEEWDDSAYTKLVLKKMVALFTVRYPSIHLPILKKIKTKKKNKASKATCKYIMSNKNLSALCKCDIKTFQYLCIPINSYYSYVFMYSY